MPPNSVNFIMPHYHSLLPLLLILLLSPAVDADEYEFNNIKRPNCTLPLQVCNPKSPMKGFKLGSQTWCKAEDEAMDPMGYNEIIINDTEFQKVLNSRNCSALFNYKLTIPSGSPISSFRFPFGDNTVIYKCNLSYKTDYDQHNFKHYCRDINSIIFQVHDHDFLGPIDGCDIFKIPFLMNPASYNFPKNTDIFKVITAEARIHGKLCSAPELAPESTPMPKDGGMSYKAKIILIAAFIGSVGAIAIGLLIVLLLNKRRRLKSSGFMKQSSTISIDSYSNTIPESGIVYCGVPVFTYEELQQSTNNFDPSRELGKGGFGIVYYGKLKDGRDVAVKRLFERTFRRVEQFKNEIEILTRLRHRNLVSLYGCSSRHSRELLLVYEYIPNGTLGCHLHGDLAKPGSLPWSVRMRIAVETASALSYLHACDIIHRDVKTSNLLLDSNFCVKVADFGLSRLFPNFVTHVSTAPQGTPGYLDPEYHHCYHLTNKSDVYSFGVVLVELISSLPAVDITRNKDEIKLANLAVKMIQRRSFSELVDPSLGFESDNEIHRMIVSVAELAFRCIQRDNELRPCMDEVVEILEKIESGKDELEHYEFHGDENSDIEMHSSLPTTLNKDGVESLKDVKPPHYRQTL